MKKCILNREQWAWAYETIVNRGHANTVKAFVDGKKLKLVGCDCVINSISFEDPPEAWEVVEPVLYKDLKGGEYFKFDHIKCDVNLRLSNGNYVIADRGTLGGLDSDCRLPVTRCTVDGKEVTS